MVNGVLDKDEVRRNHEYVRKHLELLAISAKYGAFAARREPLCTAKNILELTITGKIKKIATIPDALFAASIAMGCVIFLHARLREIFGGTDRERMGYVGGDKNIIKEVDAQLNNLNKVFPIMAKAWETMLPAINMYVISVAPRGEDRTKEEANRLTWESFIVLQDHQTADEHQQRTFINNLLYSRDSTKKFIDVFDEDFGEEGVPAWWRISGETPPAPEPKAMPKPSAGSEQPGIQPSASSSGDSIGRAPWWSTWRPPRKDQDDGAVVSATIQAIMENSAKGEDVRWVMPEKHDENKSVTIIEQCTAFGNLNIGVSFVLRRRTGIVMPITKFGPEVKAGKNASYWERYLRHLVSTLLIFDEKRKAERIIAAYLNKPNLAWLQLYTYICAKTGCLHSAKLPGATALKALIDGHDNPDAANAGISKIIKRYQSDEGPELTCEQLSNVATKTKSYVILDWPLRQKTGKHIRTFQSHTHDNGWNNVIEMSYYASADMRRGTNKSLVARIKGLINTIKGGGRWKPSVVNCSVHIWMSLYDCIHKQGFEWKINASYEYNGLFEALSELSSICGGGVFVNINNHPEFHQSCDKT